jgi:hypothetical protein
VRIKTLLLVSLTATALFGQTVEQSDSTHWSPVTLAGEFFEHDYVNYYLFGSGLYDTYGSRVNSSGQAVSSGVFGWNVGGGASAFHAFHGGSVSVAYRGDYNAFSHSNFDNGTDQYLSIGIFKAFNRHWSMSLSAGGGLLLYGSTNTFLSPGTGTTTVQTDPFSLETKFMSTGFSLNYQQTRRLGYSVSGSYFLQRYNFPGAIGVTGGSGSASVGYRLTARTSLGANYSRSYFVYQRGAGTANADSVAATISHTFLTHWSASFSGGFTRTNVTGVVALPVTFIVGNNEAVGGYILGRYDTTSSFPSFNVNVSRSFRHMQASVNAGEGLAPGNGFYLTSRAYYLNGVVSRSYKRQNFSAGGSYYRIASVANSVSTNFTSAGFSASYGYMLVKHVGTYLRYDYYHYGNLPPSPGVNDNRFSFGFNFSSRSIPITLY